MDFWCWRGRAAETAAEAEAVEARDPGMVRLGDKSSGEAWVRGGRGQEAPVRKHRQGGKGQSWGASAGRTSGPAAAAGHESEPREAGLGSAGHSKEGEAGQSLGEETQSAGKPTGGNCLRAALVP